MNQILIIAQLIVSILLIISILLQQRGGALGSAFGEAGISYATKRGAEKYIFWSSISLSIIFIILAFLNFLSY